MLYNVYFICIFINNKCKYFKLINTLIYYLRIEMELMEVSKIKQDAYLKFKSMQIEIFQLLCYAKIISL